MSFRIIFLILALVLLLEPLESAAVSSATKKSSTISVVATIKPLHSLVASVTEGVLEPILLIDKGGSPHHHRIRPSEIKKLQKAKVVFAISQNLENFTRGLRRTVYLADTKVKTLPARNTSESRTDYHIWLSPSNAIIMVEEIKNSLCKADRKQCRQYTDNAARTIAKLKSWVKDHEDQFLGLKKRSYLVFHDAYQYFERDFGLIGATVKNHHKLSIKDLLNLVTLSQELACIIEEDLPVEIEQQYKNMLIKLDPLGRDLIPSKDMYFHLMDNIAKGFQQCLQDKRSTPATD